MSPEQERVLDARWRVLRLLVECDGMTPDDAHELVWALEPDVRWSPIYAQARAALEWSARVPEPQSNVVDMRLWLSARLGREKRSSRPRRTEL